MIDLKSSRYAHMIARQEFALEKWSSVETGNARWQVVGSNMAAVLAVSSARADRHRGPGSCMPAFSVYGPITSRLEEKINRRRGTDDVSLQPDDRPMRRGRRRPISTEQSISKDIHDVGNSTHVSLFQHYLNISLLAIIQPKIQSFVTIKLCLLSGKVISEDAIAFEV